MTNAFKNAIILPPGVSAPTGNANGYIDTVDQAVQALGTESGANICTHVLAYMRAKMWSSPGAAGLIDRLGNPVSVGTYAGNATQSASDSNFNGQASINLSAVATAGSGNNAPYKIAGGTRLNQSLTTMPASFTVIASLRGNASPGAVNNLFGTSDGIRSYFDNAGDLQFSPNNGTTLATVSGALSAATTTLFWYSWDNAAQLLRYGKNSSLVIGSTSVAASYSPTSGDTVQPFGLSGLNSGTTFNGYFEGLLLLDKAYMNGAVPSDDALFTSLISTWDALI